MPSISHFQNILVGVDGSAAGHRALEQTLTLAATFGSAIRVLSVEEHLPVYAATVGEVDEERRYKDSYFARVREDVRRAASDRDLTVSHDVVPGHPAEELVRRARADRCDLIVVGRTGHSRLRHLLIGSTADRVSEHAPCPVLIVV